MNQGILTDDKISNLIAEAVKKEVEVRVNEHCNSILSSRAIEKEVNKVITPEFLKANIEKKIIEWISDNVDCIASENVLISVLAQNEKQYINIINESMIKLLKTKESQALLAEYIKDNYMYDLNNICVAEEMVDNFFKEYTFVLMPKPKKKKRARS